MAIDDERFVAAIVQEKELTNPPTNKMAEIAVVDLKDIDHQSFQANSPASLKGTVQDTGSGFNITDSTLVFDITDIMGRLQTVSVNLTTGSNIPISTVVNDINNAAGAVNGSLSGCAADDGSGYAEITSPYSSADSQVTIGSNAGDDNTDIGFALDASAEGGSKRYAIMVFIKPDGGGAYEDISIYGSEHVSADALTTYNSISDYGDL